MTERERFLKVVKGETPDRVPYFLDLGHWYRAESGRLWDLFTISNRIKELKDLHDEVKAGMYIEMGSLFEEYYEDGIRHDRELKKDTAVETFITPDGEVQMIRKFNYDISSWVIVKEAIENEKDLRIFIRYTKGKRYRPRYDQWDIMERYCAPNGLAFPSMGYTGLGSLISYYMGVENTIYATVDYPELVQEYIDTYNQKHMEIVNICARGPAPHMIFGDNLSGDVQPPPMFKKYSFEHYKGIADTLHAAGKTVSAHLDGRLKDIIGVVAQTGVDVADACTPAPTGDLTPMEIRRQAGDNMVVMGGVSPCMWLPSTPEDKFIEHVKQWLELKKINCRVVQSAGDQVPPGTKLDRIKLMYELVEEYGRY